MMLSSSGNSPRRPHARMRKPPHAEREVYDLLPFANLIQGSLTNSRKEAEQAKDRRENATR